MNGSDLTIFREENYDWNEIEAAEETAKQKLEDMNTFIDNKILG